MFLISLALLLGIISMVSGAAFVPIRQADSLASASNDCAPASVTTVYVPTTVYSPPETITIALENITSVSESLSSAASVDTAQVSNQSELDPISEPVPTLPTLFTHTIIVPIVEATAAAASNSSSGVYYVSIGYNTTNWSYTPTESTVVGTTTVTVLPVPTGSISSKNSTTTIRVTRTTTRSGSAFPLTTGGIFTGPPAPYPLRNGTSNSTLFSGVSGSGRPSGHYNTTVTVKSYNTTVTIHTTVATTTVEVTAYPTTSSIANATQTTNSTSTSTESASGYSGTNATYDNTYVTPSQYATESSAYFRSSAPSSEASVIVSSVSLITVTIESTTAPTQVSASLLSTSASSALSAPATATSCGQNGALEINFDDLPAYSPPDNNTAPYPPIFNPYEHFFWGNGWAYGPPPNEPFPPQSGDHLAEFVPSLANNSTNSPDTGDVPDSAFGAGPRAYNNNYWFDAYSVYVGCDNGATDPSIICDFVATAYQWDVVSQQEKVVATAHFPQPPCPGFKNCTLTQISFDSNFTQMSSLSLYANVRGQLKIFWIDTLELSWWNNTCAAGLARISAE